jgi:glycosyltransferase involved in cell wall biosynthesis
MSLVILVLILFACSLGENEPVYGVVAIVKNEAAIVTRMLTSVSSIASYVFICDTGSTDGTPQVARDWLKKHAPHIDASIHVPGDGHEQWVNFMYNRNQCVLRARARLAGVRNAYLLLMDADFELIVLNRTQFVASRPPAVLNMITYEGGAQNMRQPLLVAADWDCGYRLVTHEYLTCVDDYETYRLLMTKEDHTTKEREQITAARDHKATVGRYDAIQMRHHYDGANRHDKFERDILLLQDHLRDYDPTDERAWFYLARSLEHSGDYTRAFNAYYKRVMLGGSFHEEIWYATFRLGACLVANGTEIEAAARYFVDAFNYRPNRREPLYHLTRGYRVRQKYTACKLYGYHALTVPLELAIYSDDLFIDVPMYEWFIHDELAVCLSHLGEYQQSIHLIKAVLNASPPLKTLTSENRARLEANLALLKNQTLPDAYPSKTDGTTTEKDRAPPATTTTTGQAQE